MIQLFLIIVILVILITIINKTETFYNACNNNLYAMNSYYTDSDNKTYPCIDLILENETNLVPESISGSIIIKNKHSKDVPVIIDIKDSIDKGKIIVDSQNTLSGTTTTAVNTKNNEIILRLRLTEETTQYLELGNTYQITLNIKDENDNYIGYNTVEIIFNDVNVSEDNLNINHSNLLTILKNKKINLII